MRRHGERLNHAGSRRLADSNCCFGSRHQMVAHECEWCGTETTDLQVHSRLDILVCADCLTPKGQTKRPRRVRLEPLEAWIYFIQAGDDHGPVKVGIAASPLSRMAEFQTGNHLELRLVHKQRGTVGDEAELHRRLARYRIRGEWFAPEVLHLVHVTDPRHGCGTGADA